MIWFDMIYDMIYLLTAIGLTPCGSGTVHIYKKPIHRTRRAKNTQNNTVNNLIGKSAGRAPLFASYTLAITLQLRKKDGKKPQSKPKPSYLESLKIFSFNATQPKMGIMS